jgi:hypothetical protein
MSETVPTLEKPPTPLEESATRAAELASLLSSRRGEKHVVAIQDFPDPDAISRGASASRWT